MSAEGKFVFKRLDQNKRIDNGDDFVKTFMSLLRGPEVVPSDLKGQVIDIEGQQILVKDWKPSQA
jgi:hypothetical protein